MQDALVAGLGAGDRFLSLMPLFHVHGLTAVLTQLSRGGSVACVPGCEPGDLIRWIEELRPTWFTAGPPVLRVVLALAGQHPGFFRRNPLRFIRATGAPAVPELLAQV